MSTLSIKDFLTTKEEHELAKDRLNILSKELLRLGLYFQWYMFQRLAAYYVYKTKAKAYVDGYRLYISKRFLELPNNEQLFILRHEIYHIVFQHSQQLAKLLRRANSLYERNVIEIVHNIITDAIVNGIIVKEDQALGIRTPIEGYVNPDVINRLLEADVAQLGLANAIDKLLHMIKKGDVTLEVVTKDGQPVDIVNRDIDDLMEEHEVLIAVLENKNNGTRVSIVLTLDNAPTVGNENEYEEGGESGESGKEGEKHDKSRKGESGSERESGGGSCNKCSFGGRSQRGEIKKIKNAVGGSEPKTPEDLARLVREAVEFDNLKKTMEGQKTAGVGRLPASDYLLDYIALKKPEWEALLTSTLTSFISRHAIVSWHFVNRRAPLEKPGIKYLTTPDIHILLDVSGSMLDGTLEKALSRIIYIAENYSDVNVFLYQWSDGVSLPQKIDRKFAQDIKKYRKIRIESGGTVIEPAIDLALKRVGPNDVVVILTDGYIHDINKQSVIEKFRKLAQKAGLVIFASLGYIPETLPPQVVKIRLED